MLCDCFAHIQYISNKAVGHAAELCVPRGVFSLKCEIFAWKLHAPDEINIYWVLHS